MHMQRQEEIVSVDQNTITEALTPIKDSETGYSLVKLGMLRHIETSGPHVLVQFQLSTPLLAERDRIIAEAESALKALPGVESVTVHAVSLLSRRETKGQKDGLAEVKHVVAVASGKGGVGKSTVAASYAKVLAQRGYKVGLLDMDIYGPSIPSLFEVHEPELRATEQQMVIPVTAHGLKLISFGFWLGEAPAVMRGPMVSRYITQFLHDVAWGELDYLILDLPPGTGDVQLTVTQSVNIDGAVVVTTPQALSFADVGKAVLMFDKVHVPILGVVDNMAYFICNNCNTRHNIFGEGGAERLFERFGTPILGQLPLDPSTYGRPFNRTFESEPVNQTVNKTLLSLGTALRGTSKPSVDFDENKITVTWQDGDSVTVGNHELRANCRCAVCVDEFSGEQKLDPAKIREDIKAEEIRPIGNYALYIKWNDGHQTGFFTYDLIREVAAQK